MLEEVGEEAAREGFKMSEETFKLKYPNEEERKKLQVKKVQRKNVATGQMETVVLIFDHQEGIERFKIFQRRFASKRTRLGDADTSIHEDIDHFVLAVSGELGPQNTKGFLTHADVKHMEQEALSKKEIKMKQEEKKRKLKKNDSEDSSSSVAPLDAAGGAVKEKTKKAKAKAKSAGKMKPAPALPSGSPDVATSTSTLSGCDVVTYLLAYLLT